VPPTLRQGCCGPLYTGERCMPLYICISTRACLLCVLCIQQAVWRGCLCAMHVA
jgi:hypothetical protein